MGDSKLRVGTGAARGRLPTGRGGSGRRSSNARTRRRNQVVGREAATCFRDDRTGWDTAYHGRRNPRSRRCSWPDPVAGPASGNLKVRRWRRPEARLLRGRAGVFVSVESRLTSKSDRGDLFRVTRAGAGGAVTRGRRVRAIAWGSPVRDGATGKGRFAFLASDAKLPGPVRAGNSGRAFRRRTRLIALWMSGDCVVETGRRIVIHPKGLARRTRLLGKDSRQRRFASAALVPEKTQAVCFFCPRRCDAGLCPKVLGLASPRFRW